MINIRGKAIIDFDIDYDQKSVLLTEREQKIKKIIFKICSKCGEKKSISNFAKDKRNKNGRSGICNTCNSREGLKYYYLNRDKRLVQAKEYGDNHKAEKSLYAKDYRKDHREHLKKKAEKYYRKNRKRIKKRNLKIKKGGDKKSLALLIKRIC